MNYDDHGKEVMLNSVRVSYAILALVALFLLDAIVMDGACATGPQIVRGPYLQNATTSSMVVMWETDIACTGTLLYGDSPAYGLEVTDTSSVTIHELTIDGLGPDRAYHYSVVYGAQQSADAVFRTAFTEDKPVRFTIYGDTRGSDPVHGTIVNLMAGRDPDFVLHTADFVNHGRDYSQWSPQFFDEARGLMQETVIFASIGNHEYAGSGPLWYFDLFSSPRNSGNEGWYSFDYGNAHFVSLSSEDNFDSASDQYNWFINDISATDKKWKFVFLHRGPYSSGPHGAEARVLQVQQQLVPVFEQYQVDVVFSGHDHMYERSFKNGVFYVVAGGGGAPLYTPGSTPNPYRVYAAAKHHYCMVEIDQGPYLVFKAFDKNDVLFDTFTYAFPEVLDISLNDQEQIRIKWVSTPGSEYDIQYTDSLTAPWSSLGLNITANDTASTWCDDGTATGSTPLSVNHRIYRVNFKR